MATALVGRNLAGTSVRLGGRGEAAGKPLAEPCRCCGLQLLPGLSQAWTQRGGCGQVLGTAWGQPRVPAYRGDLLAPSSEPVLMAALAARHSMCKLVVKQSILLSPGGSREN